MSAIITSFTIVQNAKTPSKAIKTRSAKVQKIDIFSKGLVHGFGQKMAIFPTFLCQAIYARKMTFTIFYKKKNTFLGYKIKNYKKSKNWLFSKGVNPWFWSKNAHFSNFLFQAIQPRKMSFMIFQNEKTPFQAIKTRSSKSRKIEIFPKGLTHGFGPKMPIFPTFYFRQYSPGKCLL